MKRAFLILLMVVAALLPALPVSAAPNTEIQVIEQSVASHFPDDITFRLRVRSDQGDIVGADLYADTGWTGATRLLTAEPFTPGPEVELSAIWDTTLETIPPFVEITYHWEVNLSTGERFSTPAVETEYADATHDWQRLESENVIVFWYDRPDDFGQAVFEAAQEGYDHVARITGVETEGTIRVVLYTQQAHFCALYARGTCQDWIGGVSLPDLATTAQWGTSLEWFVQDVIPHELAHVFYMGEVFKDTWIRVPTWFNEGIAVYNERHDHSRDEALVLGAAERDELVPLRLMSARGGSVVDDEVSEWYAQAWSLVNYLSETYGEEALGELILTVAGNVQFEDALIQTMGIDLVQFEMDWREWLGYPVDFIPTPITLPSLAITQFGLPTQPRGQPAATSTPRPQATAPPAPTATAAPTDEPSPSPPQTPCSPCPGFFGLVLPLAGVTGLWVVRRRSR